MAKLAEDPTVPIEFKEGVFVMRVTPALSVQINYCPYCGGSNATRVRDCTCHVLDEWIAHSDSTLVYNSDYREFGLKTTEDGGRIFLHYCPFCGGHLPDSKRGEFFFIPDQTEMKRIKELLKSANGIEDVIRAIGTPDKRTGKRVRTEIQKRIYGEKDVLEELTYTRLSDTFDLVIQEREGDELLIAFFGKPKK